MKKYIENTINFYNQHIDEYFTKTVNLQDKEWLKTFISSFSKNVNILDIGCGFGRDTTFFASKDFNSYGIDLSPKMIEKARDYSPSSKFCVMNMLNLDFESDFFDGIWCSATLLHLNKSDALDAIREIKRVLKPNGMLYLNMKEGHGEDNINDYRYENAKKFYSYYTEGEIKKIMRDNDFDIQKFELEKNPKEDYNNAGIIYLIAKNK